MSPTLILTTLNARYSHTSFGLRYLKAQLADLESHCELLEFTIKKPPVEAAVEILQKKPKIVGFGVYIWNVSSTTEVIRELKRRSPETLVVVGGPEVSYEWEDQEICNLADFIFRGEADFTFRDFFRNYLENGQLPVSKVVGPSLPEIREIHSPYQLYSDEDLRHRLIYVEASRGCPYKCEYCLSSLDVSVRNFPLEKFLADMQELIARGVRQFKFVDRTFNLSPKVSTSILAFFLERVELGLHLHFEMVPDRLPEELKSLIEKFPRGALQFEIGVQTWNPAVARNVSRRQDYQKIVENLKYLKECTGVHTHVDLIAGLPGESFESFARGFNALAALEPDEIQVGILKRLKGAPINRKEKDFAMIYSPEPPFQILENSTMSRQEIATIEIFADFWDRVANSGKFSELITEMRQWPNFFKSFMELSEALHRHFGRTHSIHERDLRAAVSSWAATPKSVATNLHLSLYSEHKNSGSSVRPSDPFGQ